ncbi:MAG: hypothetical protein HUU20_19870 [Pirellulales bacterium]|nr:hypothetical protein [Pirellulales bacterium]
MESMSAERQFVGIRVIEGEVKTACMPAEAGRVRPRAILMRCPRQLFQALNGWWSIYEVQFPVDKPIRLKLAIASERYEQAYGYLSRRYLDPPPGILFLIAESMEHSSRGEARGG